MLRRIHQCTGSDGRQKLSDEDQFLLDALHALEKQLTTVQNACQLKQQAWIEFRLRFDTARSSFQHAMDLYGENNNDLERLKVSHRLLYQNEFDVCVSFRMCRMNFFFCKIILISCSASRTRISLCRPPRRIYSISTRRSIKISLNSRVTLD